MAISQNLVKRGDRIEIGLSLLEVELGWKVNPNAVPRYDLDVSTFLLGSQGEILCEEDFVFYGSPNKIKTTEGDRPISKDGSVIGSVDDLGDDDDNDGTGQETVDVDLSKTSKNIGEIIFISSIYSKKGEENEKYTFGQVRNAYISIKYKVSGSEILRYDLDEDFSTAKAVEFGRLYKRDGIWKFHAIGEGCVGGLDYFCNKYAKKFM
jgi:tellurium resistance protein TerD